MQTKTIRNALIVAPLSVLSSWAKETHRALGKSVRIVVLVSDIKDTASILRRALTWCVKLWFRYTNVDAFLSVVEINRLSPPFSTRRFFSSDNNPTIVITSYGLVRTRTDEFVYKQHRFDYVALDEGHTIKNSKSGTSEACQKICGSHRLLLTGTPLMNRLTERKFFDSFVSAGASISFLSCCFLTRFSFCSRYSNSMGSLRLGDCGRTAWDGIGLQANVRQTN